MRSSSALYRDEGHPSEREGGRTKASYVRALPEHVAAILSALKFKRGQPEKLRVLDDRTWENLLSYADTMRLTLQLAHSCREFFPAWVQERTAQNLAGNSRRFERIKAAYRGIAASFQNASVEHIVLKGFAHFPEYVADPRLRRQSDIDVYCPVEHCSRAFDALASLGYRAVTTNWLGDHLPTMVCETGWQWKGDLYDPDLPLPVEVHYRFWNRERAGFGPAHLDAFWSRRILRSAEDITFPGLHWVDTLGFSALQVVRDLLDNSLSGHKIYELASFLHNNAQNAAFWRQWMELHDDSLRQVQAVAFGLAIECFECDAAPEVSRSIRQLPKVVDRWIRRFASSSLYPLANMNKDALWLHIALIRSKREKILTCGRGFIPTRFKSDPQISLVTDDGSIPSASQIRKCARYAAHIASRIPIHARLIPVTLWHGLILHLPAKECETPL